MPAKFPQQRLTTTELAIGCLEDKSSNVRRSAIQLLTKLVLTHPYGLMHGGLLNLGEWEERYASVCEELKKITVGLVRLAQGRQSFRDVVHNVA